MLLADYSITRFNYFYQENLIKMMILIDEMMILKLIWIVKQI